MKSLNKEKNFVSAVVYLHNDEKKVENFLQTINKVLNENFNTYEIICVNDSSKDETVTKIEKFCEKEKVKSLSILNTSFFQGRENAMIAGLDLAVGDFVLEFESAHIDYDENLILEVYQKSLSGFDIVFASNDESQQLSSKLFYKLFNRFSYLQYKIKTNSFSVISRRGINRVKSIGVKTVYRKAVYASCGLKVSEVNYKATKTQKYSPQDKKTRKDLAINSLILFTDVGYKISMLLSILIAFVFFVSGVYTVVMYFTGTAIEGWTTTMLVVSFGFFGLFLILAIITKYLSLILNIIFSKKQYTIESIRKITK